MSPTPPPAPAVVYAPTFPEPPAVAVERVLEAVAAYFSAKGEVRGAERTATRAKLLKDLTADGLAGDAVDWAVQRHIEAGRIRAEATECWTFGFIAVGPHGSDSSRKSRPYWERKVEGCTLVGTESLFAWWREVVENRGKVRTVVRPPDPLGFLPGNDAIPAVTEAAPTTPLTFGMLLEQLRQIDVCRRELAEDPERGEPGFGYREGQLEFDIAELEFQTHPMKGRLETHTDVRGEAFDTAGLRLLRGEVAMHLGCGSDTVNAMTLDRVVAELDAIAEKERRGGPPGGPDDELENPSSTIVGKDGLVLKNGKLLVNGEKTTALKPRTYRVLSHMLNRESTPFDSLIKAATGGDFTADGTVATWCSRANNALNDVKATWRLEYDAVNRVVRRRPA